MQGRGLERSRERREVYVEVEKEVMERVFEGETTGASEAAVVVSFSSRRMACERLAARAGAAACWSP